MSEQSEMNSTENMTDERPVPSRDMFPSDEFLTLYPKIKPLIQIEDVTTFFEDSDNKAIAKKRLFVRLGTVSLILVAIVLILLSWRLSLTLLSISFPFWLEFLSAILGLIAIFIQLYLFFSDLHKKWLFARYKAEKLRLWKFQLFLDGIFVSDYLTSPKPTENSLDKLWIIFKEQFSHGTAGMDEFIDSQPLELMINPTPYTNLEILAEIKELYLMLRLDVQITHFSDQNARLAVIDSLTDSWAKVLLGTSGMLAVLETCLLGLQAINSINPQNEGFKILTMALGGVSLTFAIASAAIRVYRSASAVAENRERYRSKQNHLKRIRDFLKDESEPNRILELMTETESVCNEELQEFLISLRRADYFF